MFWESWDQDRKTKVVVAIIILAILVLVLVVGSLVAYKAYKRVCIPRAEYNQCEASLSDTILKLGQKEDEANDLLSKKVELMNESSKCREKLDKCNEDLRSIDDKYQSLLKQFSKLNETYHKLQEDCNKNRTDLEICRKEVSDLESEKEYLTGNPTPKEVYLTNSIIAVLSVTLFISIPLNIYFGDKVARRVLNFFVGTFIASMFVFGYVPIFNFWAKFGISILLGVVVAIIVFKVSNK